MKTNRDIHARLHTSTFVGDGAMGTMLQAEGLQVGELPAALNLTHPEIVQRIHRAYFEAGSDFVSSNTFDANGEKLRARGHTTAEIFGSGVRIARAAATEAEGKDGKPRFVALDIGPLGRLMEPLGDLDFDTAYALFAEQVREGEAAGADFILFETFTDIMEMKVAVLAAKENCALPVFCSLTFQSDGRMLTGTDPETAAHILQDMGISAIGMNCSLGPAEMVPLAKKLIGATKLPVIVQPNAGLPREVNGETVFDVDVPEFLGAMEKMMLAGVTVVGGCCGTSPEYIKGLIDRISSINDEIEKSRHERNEKLILAPTACSLTKTVSIDARVCVIGERLNPTGKKKLAEALRKGDYRYVEDEALHQVGAGAHIINVNAGLPDVDELCLLEQSVERISACTDTPLMIDCTTPEIIQRVVRHYRGKAIINSVNGEQKRMDAILPIVQKYGTAVIALTLDENGIPDSMEGRLSILDRIVNEAAGYGIQRHRIIVDCLTLTISAQQEACVDTLEAIRRVKRDYGMKTTLGVSNISYGLPERSIINRTFLSMALLAGLDAPIIDPTNRGYMEAVRAGEALLGKDRDATDYIAFLNALSRENQPEDGQMAGGTDDDPAASLREIILGGFIDRAADVVERLLETMEPMAIIEKVVLPALDEIGRLYDTGELFLPQMIKAAETAKSGFDVLKAAMGGEGAETVRGRVILATVKDDIHDIGKNIVKIVMENYGYEVLDLGKDVPPEVIVETAKQEGIRMVGLSALMTTTVVNMEKTIALLKAEGLSCTTAVGGAVLNADYAKKIGADHYCQTAMDTVHVADAIFQDNANRTIASSR